MKKVIRFSVATTFTLFATEANTTKEAKPMPPVVKEGVGYIKMLGKELKMNMKKHMMADKSGVKAASFCANKASGIVKEV